MFNINNFPREVLDAILKEAVHISPEEFLKPSPLRLRGEDGPAARPATYRRNVLLVCRLWLNITTRHVCHSIELTRPSHATEVAQFLEDFPHLGVAVRTLRLEGPFDLDLARLVAKTPRVENLYISLEVLDGDDVTGLTAALPLLRPRTLVLEGCPNTRSIAKIRVMRTIYRVIGLDIWNNLVSRRVPFPPYGADRHVQSSLSIFGFCSTTTRMAYALRRSRTLRSITLQAADVDELIQSGLVDVIASNPGLRSIRCLIISSDDYLHSLSVQSAIKYDDIVSDAARRLLTLQAVGQWDDANVLLPFPGAVLRYTPTAINQ